MASPCGEHTAAATQRSPAACSSSSTAATLHATHYHRLDARNVQQGFLGMSAPELSALLTPPPLKGRTLPQDLVRSEVEGTCQSILGYVERWSLHYDLREVPCRRSDALI
ncbi:MAG: hypothetical protein IOC82_03865 [Aestuariivirga sp.]|nr:hypothetical protein [Aestuariivirga sp.]